MKEQDIISFKDFLGKSLSPKSLEILSRIDFEEENIDENIENDIIEEEVDSENEYTEVEEVDSENEYTEVEEEKEKEIVDDFYYLYSDKNENFICDIHIEGANPESSEVRLIVESKNWNIMFNGTIQNGKCTIPVKSLNMLEDGQIGKIRLEVIAEGNVIKPWEKSYKVKKSKNVFVNFN